ncbi:hypothetical protein PG985_009684 [Apiospora marii]|uniref:Uncharacterized protein n=1 Tax=Apiospora marii TaxID=335849 RepID=A0ABR1RH77_9PEZI
MRFSSGLILVNSAIAKVVLGALPQAPIPGYGVEPLQWAVEVAPGQTELLNGTVQQVHEQVLQINPEFKLSPQPRELQTQTRPHKRDGVICFQPYVSNDHWADGIDAIRQLPGAPSLGPGPAACGVVSCVLDSAVWLCNDNTTPLSVVGFGQMADASQAALNACSQIPTGQHVVHASSQTSKPAIGTLS